ncbi:protein of unknown function [Methylocella tundrae]|uniref:Uncharacterized protein n=1 Tax=Methylocella tundrae TaxID=227605 RepID=A0A4V6IMS3_METTU|nr:protein of unknown function [Methylocella tundrae]
MIQPRPRVARQTFGWSIFRSDRFDLIDKDMLKLLNLEGFLIDRMTPFDRKALWAPGFGSFF